MLNDWLLVCILFSSFWTGIVIFFLPEKGSRIRTTLNMFGALLKLALVARLVVGVFNDETFESTLVLVPGLELSLRADALSVFFASLSTVLWLLTTVYAIGYLERSHDRSRFFGFFSLCVSATTGVSFAGNLFTFLVFYELLTLSTYPLVVHRGSPQAHRAGAVYLAYTLSGGALLLVAIAWLWVLTGPVDFAPGGVLADAVLFFPTQLRMIFVCLIVGFGVKAALVPLHGWLPSAMVAPAPVSSLLHAVAVVKAGAFGIVRVVYEVFGITVADRLGLLLPLAAVAALTIVYGSVRALAQDELKRRLAYSTVSQVSYITLGAAILGPVATVGGIVHLVHQGLMKITLFFTAGTFAETLGIHRVSEMDGAGRRMPATSLAFTIGALGMIGVPPLAGYVSKWYLQQGGLQAGQGWISVVLISSSLLNAAYFLPIVYRLWFGAPPAAWPAEEKLGKGETHWMLSVPATLTALLVIYCGILAESDYSPLYWAKLIAAREHIGGP